MLEQGEEVYAKIISINVYGDSVESDAGNGAVIWIEPEAPHTLTNDPTTTIDTTIKFTWTAGANDGGNSVSGHTIYYDQG